MQVPARSPPPPNPRDPLKCERRDSEFGVLSLGFLGRVLPCKFLLNHKSAIVSSLDSKNRSHSTR